MKILMQEDENTRIVERFALFEFCNIVCRQRRRWYGWKTSSWLYSHQYDTIEGYQKWFDWDERRSGQKFGRKQFQ